MADHYDDSSTPKQIIISKSQSLKEQAWYTFISADNRAWIVPTFHSYITFKLTVGILATLLRVEIKKTKTNTL